MDGADDNSPAASDVELAPPADRRASASVRVAVTRSAVTLVEQLHEIGQLLARGHQLRA